MDKVVAKSKGTPKAVKRPDEAMREGLTGVFATLAKQHRDVAALLERIRADPTKRRDLWPEVRIELISHERGEVREVYPVLRAKPELAALADHHDAEARDLEGMILELDRMVPESAAWSELFDDLADSVIQHAEEEEQDFFPKAQAALGESLARDLDAKFLRAKGQVAQQV